MECGYQTQQCPGCRSQILKKDFQNHNKSCALVELICQDCQFAYNRREAITKHTENICLKEQLRQLREECKKNKHEMHVLAAQLYGSCMLSK